MDFPTSLKQIQILLQKELTVFFARKRKEAGKINTQFFSLMDQIADLTLRGGKRMRPFLCWLGHEIAKESKARKSIVKTDLASKDYVPRFLLDAMMGLELFHTFALIHDDIIDEDEERRGKSTIHAYFSHDLRLPAGKAGLANNDLRNHFGTSMAILAGDLALAWADECMGEVKSLPAGEAGQKSKVNARILMAYQQMKEQVILGQSLDVMRQFGFAGISQTKINELKTAWYSVVWPLAIGALLASAPQKDILRLQRYGLLVGQAFQLRDDLMDGDMTKKDFILQTKEYKRNVEKAINAFPVDDQKKKLLSDVATFVIMRHS